MAALVTNLVMVLVLALGIWALGRFVHRPALLHGLWLVVLLRLFAPPLFEVSFLPSGFLIWETAEFISKEPVSAEILLPAPSGSGAQSARAEIAARSGKSRLSPTHVVFGIWGAGSLLILLIATYRIHRFRSVLRLSDPAGPELQRRANELAVRMGLDRAPPLRLIPGAFPPLVWSWAGQQHLVVPRELLPGLELLELDALLLHELAHVRRRDDLVRLLEVASGVVFWWYPVVWWVHRRLRHCEELSCDAWVVRVLPRARKVYADALLKTLEFLNRNPQPVPRLACGIGHLKPIEERLTMIMKNGNLENWTPRQKVLLVLAGIVALAVFPTWAETPRSAQQQDPVEVQLQQIDQQSEELRIRLRELERQRKQIQWQQRTVELQNEIQALHDEAARLRSAGNQEDARWAETQADLQQRRFDLEHELYILQVEGAERRERLIHELQESSAQLELLIAEGREEEARLLQRDLERKKTEHARELKQLEMTHRDLRLRQQELAQETRERQAERLRYLGREEDAEALLNQDLVDLREVKRRDAAGAARAIEEMARYAARLEEEGRAEEAEKIREALELRKAALLELLRKEESEKSRRIKEVPQQ